MDYKYIEHELGDVLTEIFSGGTPNTQKKDYWNGDLHWLSSGETRNRIIKETEKSITELGAQNSSTKLAKGGDIVMASAGQGFTRGQTSIIEIDTYINQSLIALRGNPQIIDNKYLFYNLSSRYQELRMLSDSSSIRGSITTKMLKKMKIMLPNIEKQKSVSSFLWDLDKKIDINKAIINNLDQLSQTLFKQWFIDFEFPNEEGLPYKSSGGEMVESELGEIPKLFKWKLLNEICEVKDGTHDSPKQVDVGYPLVTSKHLKNNEIEFNTTKLISETDFIKVNKRSLVEYKDILISMIGTVGRLYFVQEKNINYAIKNIGLIKSSQTDFSEYIYMYFKSPSMINYIKERMTGSTQQYISLTELRKIPILRPNKEIIDLYLEKSSVNFDMIHNLILENQNLQQLRDTLLPKLLSGEIEIPDNLEV